MELLLQSSSISFQQNTKPNHEMGNRMEEHGGTTHKSTVTSIYCTMMYHAFMAFSLCGPNLFLRANNCFSVLFG